VAVQFSLSYDANGDPVLVENTVTGTRKVVSRSSVVSPYKSRFEAPASSDPITDAEENQPESNQSAIMDYIMEMEKGADTDPNLSFVQKQNLERYTPEAIEARNRKKTRSQEIVETVIKAVLPYADAAGAAVKALEAILPEESEEIKAIKQFYADPAQQQLVESIPGMSDYNLVYGNPFDPSYGLANAAQKRIDRINKTLEKKDSEVLRERKKKLQELIDRENKQQEEIRQQQINPVQNLTPQQKDYFRNGGSNDGGSSNNIPSGIREDTPGGGEFSSPSPAKTSQGTTTEQFQAFRN
jgi:hypothetical protein